LIVVDATVVATALADETVDGDIARARMRRGRDLHAPHLIDLEVCSALRRQTFAGLLTDRRFEQAIEDLAALPITRYPHIQFLGRVFELRHNLTPYDAVYVALAEALSCTLVTSDGAFEAAPNINCEVELLETLPSKL